MLAHPGGIWIGDTKFSGLSLLEVSPWNEDVGFWQTSEFELGCGISHSGCAGSSSRTLC